MYYPVTGMREREMKDLETYQNVLPVVSQKIQALRAVTNYIGIPMQSKYQTVLQQSTFWSEWPKHIELSQLKNQSVYRRKFQGLEGIPNETLTGRKFLYSPE